MTEIAWTQAVAASTINTYAYPAVSPTDLGFAMGIFVAAGSRRLGNAPPGLDILSEEERMEQQHLFASFVAQRPETPPGKTLPYQASLREAFAALWHEHREHGERAALCARVLCFHLLMERTAGSVIAHWTYSCPETPEVVHLDPAVVEALAQMPLIAGTELNETKFLAAIAKAHRMRSLA